MLDLFIVGGGINGCGIARDAAGRGLKVGLAEMNDIGSGTSSASTKLFHGGLRYLEYFEFRLVREALREREVLLKAMPHISWPMRFVLPIHPEMRFESDTPTSRLLGRVMPWLKGRRPACLIRLGLFLYDSMGARQILPGTKQVDLTEAPEGAPLKDNMEFAYEYSDCWVQDARLVALNARDAAERGAEIMVRAKVTGARRMADHWEITVEDRDRKETHVIAAKVLVNAGGPWVSDIIGQKAGLNTADKIRLVRGSHIVVKRLFDHDKAYFFQGTDGRIIFAIPYEEDFTLIGTTDQEHPDPDTDPVCTDEERDYLINFANSYLKSPVSTEDVVWSFSGVRPLFDDGEASASAASRDYTLKLETGGSAPMLNVFGGKITTYRRLSEAALDEIAEVLPGIASAWTAGVALPGGDFAVDGVASMVADLQRDYDFLDESWARRLVKAYGTDARTMLGDAKKRSDLGEDFGATLTEREADWLIRHEFARTAEDVIWRRSKLGLLMTREQVATLGDWMRGRHRPMRRG